MKIVLKFTTFYTYRLSVDSQVSLVEFCLKICDQVEARCARMWPEFVQVLAYLIAKYFPATVVPTSVKNALKAITFQSQDKQNFYRVNFPSRNTLLKRISYSGRKKQSFFIFFLQILGVVQYLEDTHGFISSPIGYVLFSKDNDVDVSQGDLVKIR